ncbi:hypothetical protein FGLOB1_8193 [Fusarium globosum]|uniref:Uncharacterized protein n=1 Tax=Fusarium globosum TaxID=78864 RepID=A0A8H5Y3A9_9HYPO|nr:hypothetical protein FGLOB1_8193 [Fusarium globosum]
MGGNYHIDHFVTSQVHGSDHHFPLTNRILSNSSTTFTHISFPHHISTSLPNHPFPSRKSSPPRTSHPSPVSLPSSEETPKPTSTQPPPVAYLKPSKMSITLPNDVLSIDTGKKSLMFYVYPEEDSNNILSYLGSPNDKTQNDWHLYGQEISERPKPFHRGGRKHQGVRGYYFERKDNHLRELCKSGDGDWFVGSLSVTVENFKIRAGTSNSASVHADQSGNNYELRVFAAEEGKVNLNGIPQIAVIKYARNGLSDTPVWDSSYITEKIKRY